MIRVSIIGATGYVGLELVRLLTTHGEVKIQHLISSGSAGEELSRIYPQLIPFDLPILEKLDIQAMSADTDVFFVALPHGVSQDIVIELFFHWEENN